MGRLIAISNRTAADPTARAGGLAVAVWESLQTSQGMWIGWSGETTDSENRGVKSFRDDGVEFVLTDLTHAEHESFYLDYSNSVLWPIFHYRVDLADFSSNAFDAYAAVNKKMAAIAAERARPEDTVWVHDYHFLLVADYLRRFGYTGPTGFFLHIPFPPPEIFRVLPEHAWIARAMAAFDVIGFQSEQDRKNFENYMKQSHSARIDDEGIMHVFGEQCRVRAYPIGIDAEGFAQAAESPVAKQAAQRISRFLGGRKLVVGCDRMDYSKGLPERFAAVGRLFDEHPELHGKVSVTQITPPSRSKVEEYRQLREQLDGLAGRINGDYGDLDWIPLRYLARSYTRDELAGLFRTARVGLVTPLRDGMNLVAKEFVMAQNEEDPGVLILSEFAGAAEQLSDALIVNPHDSRRLSETINMALNMDLVERRERWQRMREIICDQDVNWWRRKFLADLNGETVKVAA